MLAIVDLDEWADKAGVPLDQIRHATMTMAKAESCAIFEDLGIQMAPHSTLNSYLEKLIFILTGNFGVKGGMNLHTAFGKLAGGGGGGDRRTPVGNRILGGLMPCNGIPDEILTTHPDRLRAAFVESSNPVHSLADTKRWREAFEALEFSVVIDVAMTETAECADYVLPTSTQYEKAEATFFTFEFPENFFHLRPPIVDPIDGVLPEPEIHRRLCRELGVYNDDDLAPLHAAATHGLDAYADAFLSVIAAVLTSADTSRSCCTRRSVRPCRRAWNPPQRSGASPDLRDQQPRVRRSGRLCEWQRLVQRDPRQPERCCLLERLVRGHLGSHALRRQRSI